MINIKNLLSAVLFISVFSIFFFPTLLYAQSTPWSFYNNPSVSNAMDVFYNGVGAVNPAVRIKTNGQISLGTIQLTADSGLPTGGYTIRRSTAMEFRGGTAGYSFINNANTANIMTMLDSGSVGIGTTSPGGLLQVGTYSGSVDSKGGVLVASGTGVGGARRYWIGAAANPNTHNNNNFAIADFDGTNTTNLVTIYGAHNGGATGFVGIGTTSPGQKLEVYGNSASVLPLLRLQNANGSGWASAMDFYTQYGGTPYSTARINSGASGNYGGQFSIEVSNSSRTLVNRMTIGSDGTTNFYGTTTCSIGSGSSATNCSSDGRLKKNVTNISPTLDKINALRPITFNWKDPNKPQDTHMGFIAQEVEPLFPDLVKTGPDGYEMLEYGALVTPIIKAMQEQNEQISQLSVQIKSQQQAIDQLKHDLELLKNK